MNEGNLVPNEARTPEKRRENARKAGKASGKARREKREMKAVLEELLSLPSAEREGLSNMEAVCVAMLKKAQEGNVHAAMFVRDTIGQKPTDKVAQSGTLSIGWDDEISKVIMEARERADKLRANPPTPIEVQATRTPGEFHKELPKPDNRIVFRQEPPKNSHTEKQEPLNPFEYDDSASTPNGMTARALRLQRYAANLQRSEGRGSCFGTGWQPMGADE